MALERPVDYASSGWSMAKSGARRAWNWLAYPWTWSATQTATFVDNGPVGQQLRNLDGRAQVHGAAIEIMSAQISDIARDHGKVLAAVERQRDVFERVEALLGRLTDASEASSRNNSETLRVAGEIRNQLFEGRSLTQDVASTRSELADGIKRVQQTLAEEAASLRSRLAPLPSAEQVRSLIGEHTSAVHEKLATMPSTEHVHTLIGGGMVVDEVSSVRQELTDEIRKVHNALSQVTRNIDERLSNVPSATQFQTLLGGGVAQEAASTRAQMAGELQKIHEELAQVRSGLHQRLEAMPSLIGGEFETAKKQLFDEMTTVHEALAAETASVHQRIAELPSAEQVQTMVGGTLMQELNSARTQLATDIRDLHQKLAQETASVQALLATLPSTERVQTLFSSSNSVANELATTRAHIADVLQKVHQVLVEHKADVRDRLASLPTSEQIHAFVEGGTASNIQSARRLFAEETQRNLNNAERMTKKLEFLQSRSVIPLTAQGLVMCRNPLGFLAVPADDLATIAQLADGVLPEPGALKAVEKYLKPGGTFVDVGANVGVYSLHAAHAVGPTGRVISIEPAPATARALRATVDANGLSEVVTVKEVAVGAEQGLGTLTVAQNSGQSSLLPSDGATSVVAPIVPLDELLAGTLPDMVKIDVEGWEPQVIEGMKGILRANPDIILIMDFEPAHIRSTGLSAAGWVDRLHTAGLQIFEIDDRNGELSPLRTRGLEEIVSINVLIARNDPSRREANKAAEGWLKLGPATLPS